MSGSAAVEIDEELYSRQLYTLGRASMQRLRLASVLIIGVDATFVQIKNFFFFFCLTQKSKVVLKSRKILFWPECNE